jgi:hypothetical protein
VPIRAETKYAQIRSLTFLGFVGLEGDTAVAVAIMMKIVRKL